MRRCPWPLALPLAAVAVSASIMVATQLTQAAALTWWPLLLIASPVSRRSRRMLILAALAAGHPIRLVDDMAYAVGGWRGVLSACGVSVKSGSRFFAASNAIAVGARTRADVDHRACLPEPRPGSPAPLPGSPLPRSPLLCFPLLR